MNYIETSDCRPLYRFRRLPGAGESGLGTFETQGRQEIPIRPGLWMSMINFSPDGPICLEYEKESAVIDFGFVISGNINKKMGRAQGQGKEIQVVSKICGFGFSSNRTGMFRVPARETLQILHIHMSLPFFKGIMGDDPQWLPPVFKTLMGASPQKEISSFRPMSPAIQAVVYQVLNNSVNAFPRHLFLEAKVLELISLYLAELSMDGSDPARMGLSQGERKRIPRAEALLVEDLNAPPTLADLASAMGMSVAKLQAGFREVYGKTVYDYFREYRLQKAKTLLDRAETNVSETAWQVGYVNVSHFSSAFKKRFGILPKQYLKTSVSNSTSGN